MSHLWSSNTPAQFWLCELDLSDELWETAFCEALPLLGLKNHPKTLEDVLKLVLGEEQFGSTHWDFDTTKQLYYNIKPLLPDMVKQNLRRIVQKQSERNFPLGWPVEPRYAQFQWEIMRQLLLITGEKSLSFRYFWPNGARFAFVLTHDIETTDGQSHVREIADLEESLGFRSSFAFVPERYELDYELMQELEKRGFEIAVHGLKHDGKDFESQQEYMRRSPLINHYVRVFRSKGFHAPLTLRQPEWMQTLEIDYDRSFFDTDPYEPNAGGVMSIWPFNIGHFLELPYTLAQDYTLAILLQERSSRIWQEKLKFIKQYHGMALMVTHPDYLKQPNIRHLYYDFLLEIKEAGDYWSVLPRELARWWRKRSDRNSDESYLMANAVLVNDCVKLYTDISL